MVDVVIRGGTVIDGTGSPGFPADVLVRDGVIAEVGTDVLGKLGPFVAPCRVVYVVDEHNRRGFAYGSLPGHAVAGEEMFGVRFQPADESVHAEVVAFSRPATWWSQIGAPVASVVQRVITRRYLSVV